MVGATDIGLPLSEPGHVALLPTNIKAFGEGLEQSSSDVTLYLALRECARQRLFASAGWLRAQMLTLVEQYASGITIDTSALEQAVEPARSKQSGGAELIAGGRPVRAAEDSRTTRHLERLETMLALVEGWVDEVVTQATARTGCRRHLPWPRPYAGLARRAGLPRRPSPHSLVLSCGRGGCGMPPTSGLRCATPVAWRVETPSGHIQT